MTEKRLNVRATDSDPKFAPNLAMSFFLLSGLLPETRSARRGGDADAHHHRQRGPELGVARPVQPRA
jgi:hypothetical protein